MSEDSVDRKKQASGKGHGGLNRRHFIGASVAAAGFITAGAKAESPATQASGGSQPYADGAVDFTKKVTETAAKVSYDDLDKETVTRTKNRVLDLVGCLIGGVGAPGNAELVSVVAGWGGKPECTIAGYPDKLPALNAAMINAISARSYDFEVMDTFVEGRTIASHTSPTTQMTALAIAERSHRSGKEFITALTVGDDLVARLIASAGFNFANGWDAASVHSGMGAALIAAKLMGLDAVGIRDSLGLAVNHLSGTIQAAFDGSTDWKLPQGAAARNGIVSAELAAAGWTGMDDPLTAPFGFYHQYTGGLTKPEILIGSLGKKFYAEGYFKPYPACAATHAGIECALELVEKNGLKPSDIDHVLAEITASSMKIFVGKPYVPRRYPQADANFSMQFQVANVFLNGRTVQEHYDEAALRSTELANMVKRVSLKALPAGEPGARLHVTTKDGRTLTNYKATPDRWPTVRFPTRKEMLDKFMQQVDFSHRLNHERAQEIIAMVDNIENLDDMSKLTALLPA